MLKTSNLELRTSALWQVQTSALWLCLIVGVGGFLRLYGLEFHSLWQDEGLQYYVATQNSLGELFQQRRSFHPPLSFMINHVFLVFGGSDFLLRLPSALFGMASLPLMYVLARDLTSKREAVFAVLVLALSPFHIWYSQEGRMYSQLLFVSLLSSVILMQALKRGQARWWFYYAIVSAAGIYTHVFMLLGLLVHFLWLLLYERRYLPALMATSVVVALLFLPWALTLPWIGHFARSVSKVGLVVVPASAGRAGFTLAAVPYTFFVYAAGFSLGPTVAELHGNRSAELILRFLPSILLVTSVFAILWATGLWAICRRFGARPLGFCLLGLFVPLAGVVVYSLTPRATFNVRYTVMAFPYFCLFVGTGLAYLFSIKKVLGAAAVLTVIGISSVSVYNHFANPRYTKENIKSAVGFWRQQAQDEPLLAIGSTWSARRYVGVSEAEHVHIVGGKDIVAAIDQVLTAQNTSSAYVSLARDWNQAREIAISKAFSTQVKSYPGVKLLKISRRRPFQTPEPLPDRPLHIPLGVLRQNSERTIGFMLRRSQHSEYFRLSLN